MVICGLTSHALSVYCSTCEYSACLRCYAAIVHMLMVLGGLTSQEFIIEPAE